VARAKTGGELGEVGESIAAILASVLALFTAFVERVASFGDTVRMAGAEAGSQTLNGDGLMAAVFAVVVWHGGGLLLELSG
jgi:hypothetical protein